MVPQLIIIILFLSFVVMCGHYRTHSLLELKLYLSIGITILLYCIFKDGDMLTDYASYEYLFQSGVIYLEPTFQLIVYIVKRFFNNDIFFMFLIYSVLGIGLKLYAVYKLSNLVFCSLLIWLSDLFIQQDLTQIRAAVATSLLLICIREIYYRNGKKFLMLSLIAVVFHYSAIIIFPLWFLNSNRISVGWWMVAFVVAYIMAIMRIDPLFIVGLIPIDGIAAKYELYTSMQSNGGFVANIFSVMFMGKAAITLLLCVKWRLIKNYNRYTCLLIKIMFLSLISLLVLSQNLAFALRVSEFYGIVAIILFPMLIYAVKPQIAGRTALVFVAITSLYFRIFISQLILLA